MASLPKLRTVREPAVLDYADEPPARPVRMPAAAATLLNELQTAGLLGPYAVEEFTEKVKDQLTQLNKPERVLAALVLHGMLTEYQRNRVESGNTYGLAFGHYRILERISGGTVGVVFRAEHTVLKKHVAVKVLPADETINPERVARVRTEMEVVARLDHPHIVTVHDAGVIAPPVEWQPTLHYLVLELIDGGDLEHFVYANGKQSVPAACELARQLAAGLAYAHGRNVIHRDLKPSNILITTGRQVKITDFGLARHFASTLTVRPGVIGSVEFMPPEQAVDPTVAGPAADVYGLAATLFWVLTGELPHPKAVTLGEALKALTTTPPRRLKDLMPGVPEPLDQFVARMLRRNPAERPSALEAAATLSLFAAPGVLATAEPLAGANHDTQEDQLRAAAARLGELVRAREQTAASAQAAVLTALATMAQARGETAGEQRRVAEYVRVLAAQLARHSAWPTLADPAVVKELQMCAAARNVGIVAVPDAVFFKSGDLTPAEDEAVRRHVLAGDELLTVLAAGHGDALAFLRTARAVIRHHHEKWDGTGYPDRLAREGIPPAARVVALADVYDALRRGNEPGTGVEHLDAVDTMFDDCPGHFDPVVLDAFKAVHYRFNEIYTSIPD